MALIITDEDLKKTGLSENELRLEIAIHLFETDIFTLGKAAEFCGISQAEMMEQLGSRKIPMHYDIDMLHEDIKTIRTLKNDYSK